MSNTHLLAPVKIPHSRLQRFSPACACAPEATQALSRACPSPHLPAHNPCSPNPPVSPMSIILTVNPSGALAPSSSSKRLASRAAACDGSGRLPLLHGAFSFSARFSLPGVGSGQQQREAHTPKMSEAVVP